MRWWPSWSRKKRPRAARAAAWAAWVAWATWTCKPTNGPITRMAPPGSTGGAIFLAFRPGEREGGRDRCACADGRTGAGSRTAPLSRAVHRNRPGILPDLDRQPAADDRDRGDLFGMGQGAQASVLLSQHAPGRVGVRLSRQ